MGQGLVRLRAPQLHPPSGARRTRVGRLGLLQPRIVRIKLIFFQLDITKKTKKKQIDSLKYFLFKNIRYILLKFLSLRVVGCLFPMTNFSSGNFLSKFVQIESFKRSFSCVVFSASQKKLVPWNKLDTLKKVDRRSFMGQYSLGKDDLLPRNPIGRTGLKGRGLLGRWGPNHAADPIVTRYNESVSSLRV